MPSAHTPGSRLSLITPSLVVATSVMGNRITLAQATVHTASRCPSGIWVFSGLLWVAGCKINPCLLPSSRIKNEEGPLEIVHCFYCFTKYCVYIYKSASSPSLCQYPAWIFMR